MPIDRAATLPLHAQLQDSLRESIARGELAAGEQLPTEPELAARFGVNRLTVRHALAELAREGLIVARQGIGTFVAPRRQPFIVPLSASDWAVEHDRAARAAQQEGHTVSETLLDVQRVDPTDQVIEHLGRGSMLWLESVYHADGEPIIRSQYWARSTHSPQEVRDAASAGLTPALLREVTGAAMYYAWRSFDAIAASRRHAAVLDVPQGTPLLQRCGLNADIYGRPLMYLQRDAPHGRMRILLRNEPPTR